MKLHHCAYTIVKGYSHIIEDFAKSLGAKVVWEGADYGREITLEFPNKFCIQFSEIKTTPIKSVYKKETHLAFSSSNPHNDVLRIVKWFESKGIRTETGKWSDTAYWIDCPDVFCNFCVEVVDVR